ncbi:MAG TPA: DUF3857 domain-containing transglutaminase family protein [Gemmatimonadaceae bacterium]|nr:DUF3857 domain-containing transglutaminase family protein [Gemmatimonadaceae bacterium]
MFRRTAFLLAFASALPLAAQAPKITQQGDPTIKSDSIYSLAVKASDHPDEDAVFLLDDGVVRREADGRGTQTFRQVVQLLKPGVVDNYREFRWSWAPGHERFTLNWIRVIGPDGKVISEGPSHEQDSDVPAQMGDPVYSDRKVKRVSLSGVAPGTLVDYSYTREELKPYLTGDFFQSWSVSTGLTVRRSRFVVDVPSSLAVRLHERNLNFPRKTEDVGGRRIYTWLAADVPRLKGELYAADSNTVQMHIALSSPITWQDIGAWYAKLARDRYSLGSPSAKKLKEVLTATAPKTRDDTIRAVHRWVAQDIRYVSIALGLGGYQPRSPDTVVVSGFGDCKDKATLFVAAMNSLGITTFPVLLNSTGVSYRELASIDQLDHAIAAVKTPSGYQFTDLTAEFTPYGELPYDEQGELVLVVHPDGATEEKELPLTKPADNATTIRIVGTLSPDGTFSGRYDEAATGALQYTLRSVFENPLDSTEKANAANAIASKLFDGAEGDSLVGFEGKDLLAKPHMSLLITHGKAASRSGETEIFTIPLGSTAGLKSVANQIDNARERHFPIDAVRIFGNRTSSVELRVKLPAGWKAQLPSDVKAASPFGSYESTYAQVGDELVLTRKTAGATGVYPADRIKDVSAWFRQVATDDAKLIVISTK